MRIPVELRRAYRLINHGPTTIVGSAAGDRTNLMAAAWVMALDIDPPKVAAVIAGDTLTRRLVEASGEFAVSVPTVGQLDLTWALGSISGEDEDKIARFRVPTFRGTHVAAPLVEGCAAWLECRVVPEPGIAERYDLFVGDVLAAWADDRDWVNGTWAFSSPERRTIHHLAGGAFLATGERLQARRPDPSG